MIPRRVTLENFLSFGPKQVLEFSDDEPLWIVGGPNGVGKSAIFDAMTYALFACHRGGKTNHDLLIRHGANRFEVGFEFTFDSHDYQIIRSRGRGNARPTQSVRKKSPEGEWVAIPNVNSVDDVNRWVTETLGLQFDQFTASVLLRQGEAEKIITATGAQRLQVLKKVIGADQYEGLSQRVHEATRGAKASLDAALRVREQAPAVTPEEQAAAEAMASQATQDVEKARAARRQAEERARIAGDWQRLRGIRNGLADRLESARQLRERETLLRQQTARLQELSEIVPRLRNIVTLRAEVNRRAAEETKASQAVEELRQATEAREAALRPAREKETQLREQLTETEKHAEDLRRQIQQDETALQLARKIDQARSDQAKFPADLREQVRLAEDAHRQAKDRAEVAGGDWQKAEARREQLAEQVRQFAQVAGGARCSRCRQPVTPEHAELERQHLAKELGKATDAATIARQSLDEAKAFLKEAERNATQLAKQNQELALAERTLSTLLQARTDPTPSVELHARITTAKRQLGQHDERTRQTRIALTDTKSEITRLEADLGAQQTRLKKLDADLALLRPALLLDQGRLDEQLKNLPSTWAQLDTLDLPGLDQERDQLERSGVAQELQELERAQRSQAGWEEQLREAEAALAKIPAEAQLDIVEVKSLLDQAQRDTDQAEERVRITQRDLDRLLDRKKQYEKACEGVLDAQKKFDLHKTLDELLGKNGLQKELVRAAEVEIVDYAQDTLRQLSDGDLSIQLKKDSSDEGNDPTFELQVYRAQDPEPIAVDYLSGSQKFRVAVAVALAIGRYARGQARPIESVIIDEGFGSLDREGLRAAADELLRLKDSLARIILVSHQEEFTDRFRVGYQLEPTESGTVARSFRR